MNQDDGWTPRSPLGWALGFAGTVMLFASVYLGEKPAAPPVITVEPKITTIAVRTVAHSLSPFISETVCLEALPAERSHSTDIAGSGDSQVSLYHCERMAESHSIEMVSTSTMQRVR